MRAYNVFVGEMKVGTVFEYNIFDATHAAASIYGMNVEVLEAR